MDKGLERINRQHKQIARRASLIVFLLVFGAFVVGLMLGLMRGH